MSWAGRYYNKLHGERLNCALIYDDMGTLSEFVGIVMTQCSVSRLGIHSKLLKEHF